MMAVWRGSQHWLADLEVASSFLRLLRTSDSKVSGALIASKNCKTTLCVEQFLKKKQLDRTERKRRLVQYD